MNNSSTTELEGSEPPNLPPDKFKIPLPRGKSAFKAIDKSWKQITTPSDDVKNIATGNKLSTYEYILMKALRSPTDITDNEKMILRSHPVIAELIKQTRESGTLPKQSYYIPIEVIINYDYFHSAKVPILNDSPEKWSLEANLVQYVAPHDEEVSSESTKGYSDYNLMLDEDDQKTIGKYTIRERKERIRRYKLKLQKYKLGLCKSSNKYQQRSIIAKTRPRMRGKFAKTSPPAYVADH